jgi:hypothetical protein
VSEAEAQLAEARAEIQRLRGKVEALEWAFLHLPGAVDNVEEPTPAVGQHVASPLGTAPDSAMRSPGAARTARYRARLRAERASQPASPSVTGDATVTPAVTGEVVASFEAKSREALEKDASTPYSSPVTPSVTGVTPSQGGAIPSTLRGIAPVEHFALSPPPPVEKKTRRAVSPRHAPLKAALLAAYREHMGADYPALWVKDSPAIGRLVEMCPDDAALVAAWKRALAMGPYPGTKSIAVFASRLPEFMGAASSAPRPLTPQEDRQRRAPIRAGDVDWSRT